MVDEFSQVLRPKVKEGQNVREERQELLRLLDVAELPKEPAAAREKKRAIEAKDAAGAEELEFFEKRWLKRSPENLSDIRRYVDGLQKGAAPPPTRSIAMDITRPRGPERRTRFGERQRTSAFEGRVGVSAEEMRLLRTHIQGRIEGAYVIYRTARSKVISADVERDGKHVRTLATIVGDRVASLNEIRSDIDERPRPKGPRRALERSDVEHATMKRRSRGEAPPRPREAAAPEEAAPSPDETAEDPTEKADTGGSKGRLGFLRRKKD